MLIWRITKQRRASQRSWKNTKTSEWCDLFITKPLITMFLKNYEYNFIHPFTSPNQMHLLCTIHFYPANPLNCLTVWISWSFFSQSRICSLLGWIQDCILHCIHMVYSTPLTFLEPICIGVQTTDPETMQCPHGNTISWCHPETRGTSSCLWISCAFSLCRPLYRKILLLLQQLEQL